jgi:phage-related baseplate assembly protein
MSIINNNISVCIDGKRLFSFKSLKLHQPINDHHRFELSLDLEVGGNLHAHNLTDGAKWIGKPFEVRAGEKSETTFVGVVTGVSLHRTEGDFGHILVSGHSETYLLETDLNFHSWNDCTLADIVKEMASNAGVSAKVNPEYKERLDYVCQYNESDFSFIKRLARQYNEWLYYDGFDLVFGRPARLPAAVGLEFGTSLSSLDIGVKALARPSRVFSYHSLYDRTIAEETPNTPTDKDQLGYEAFMASMGMYKRPARQHALPRIHYPSEMTRYVRKKQEADTAESHYVVGRSEHAMLVTGSVVDLKSSFLERAGSVTGESLGEFLITEITHVVGEGSYYGNKFKAIPAVADTLPVPAVELPVAETQMAKVVRNDDKLGHGRVQVQMNWQTGAMRTGWIRVMTPDGGGGGDGVETNRGFVFIPEVGDHVLVGFRHGDPNRPYVMGSLFNGRTGKGGGEGNNCKSICTRSGISIAFDDDSRALTLSDPSGNMVLMDGHGHMELNAPNGIVMNASHIAMNTGGNITLNVGGELMASVAGNWLTSVGGAMNAVTNSYRTTVVNALEMCSASALFSTEMGMQLQGETLNAIGTKKLLMHSDEQVLANSRGRMDMKSDGSLNMEQKADDVEKEEKEQMALATVEFRPDAAYNGEFGFDWLRVKDGELPAETPYKNIIVGGYCDGERNLTPKEAYDKLKEEYEHIPITFRKDEESKYFVPYLNLYSKECVEGMKVDEDVPKPCYEASLRVVVDINEDVDRLEFDYDKDIFEIDKPTLKDKGKTKDKVKSQDDKVKITCKKSFDDETKGIIRVFAYPKECAGKQMADQVRLRSLAGKIKVGVNDLKAQKEMEFVLVCVKTLLAEGQTPQTGTFGSDHLHLLSNTLHHMYINPSFEQFLKDKEGKLLYDNKGEKMRIVLDFSQKPYSEQIEKYREGNVLRKNPIPNNQEDPRYMTIQRYLDENLANFLRTTFLDTYPQYSSSFTIFSFAEDGGFGKKGLPGFCELAADIKTGEFTHFKKNVVLFKNRLPTTLCHEILHGLGLPHTHLEVVENKKGEMETEIIKEKDKKYAFERGATDNIMSYAKERKTTWNWQWKIVREKS